jgi:hypothetical protein
MWDLAALTADEFEPLIGTNFEVSGQVSDFQVPGPYQPSVLAIRLVEVQRLPERPGQRQPFVLHFEGPTSPVLLQQMHRVSHAELGDIEFFLGPVMSDGPGVTYEAVFN